MGRPSRIGARRGSKNRSGVALLTAIFFSLLCLGLATAFLLQVPVDLSSTASVQRNTESYAIADAGIQASMAWISHQLGQGQEPCTVSDPTPTRTGALKDWTWTCSIEPDDGTPPNSLTDLRVYRLTSTASRDGVPHYRITSEVQGGQSFARFSMYIDRDDSTLWDYAVSEHTQVRGPIHKNHPIRFYVASNFYSGERPPNRPFDGSVSTAASNHLWSSGGNPAANGDKYDYVFENGLSDLQFGAPPRPLPGESSILASAAWGGALPETPPQGVSVNPTGGIFIEGDVDHMELKVDSGDKFTLEVIQNGEMTTIVEDPSADARIVIFPDGATQVVAGIGNGTIFSTGNIHSLRGVNKGPHTIANAFDQGKTIEVSGSLTRSDTPAGDEPSTTEDRLGLISQYVYIADESVLPRSLSSPLYLYATILATERLEVKQRTSGNPGAMAIFGGLSSGTTWSVNQFSVPSMQVLSGYGGLTGHGTPKIVYDSLLANEPPPEYPTTAGTELTVRSWREQPL